MTPISRPVGVPSSVTATVECPVLRVVASTSASVADGRTLLSLITKPALWLFTRRTISACDDMDCEPKMKASPPERASAMANLSSETACIIAEVIGTLMLRGAALPRGNLTSGVVRSTAEGTIPLRVRLGTSRYSPKVRLGSSYMCAIRRYTAKRLLDQLLRVDRTSERLRQRG